MNKWFAYDNKGYAKHPCTQLAHVYGPGESKGVIGTPVPSSVMDYTH